MKALYWIILVHQHRKKHQQHHKHAHVMICFVRCFWWQQTILCHNYCAQKMHNWIFEATQHHVCQVNYNMVKHIWLWWALQMCHCIITDVNVATGIYCYYWPFYQCTRKWQRSCRCPQRHLKTVYFPINVNCATSGWKTLLHTNGYAHWDPYIWF